MIKFTYKKKGIKIEQQWFTDNKIYDHEEGTQILIVHGMDKGIVDKKILESQNTLLSDISVPEDDIYVTFRKNTKYEIRRADKEKIVYKSFIGKDINEEIVDEFADVFVRMYESKNIKKDFNKELVMACVEAGFYAITVCYKEGEPLVYHSYLFDENNTRLYQSCSLFRENPDEAKLIGIANKGLHWYDIKLFKNMGIGCYDWGGIMSIENPNGIDQFKIGFGGKPYTYYNATIPVGVIGKSVLFAKSILQ